MIGNIAAGSVGAVVGYRATVLADSPTGFWLLDETSGTTATDLTTNANNLTYRNTPTLNVSTGLVGIPTGITLNGTDEDVKSANEVATFNTNNNSNWSAEIWFKSNTSSLNQTLYSVRDSTGASGSVLFALTLNYSAAGTVLAYSLDSAGSGILLTHAGSWNDNVWHQAVVTAASGGAFTLYIDGVSRASSSTTRFNNSQSRTLYLGSNFGSLQYYTGSLAAGSIYNTTLSGTRVTAHYNAGK